MITGAISTVISAILVGCILVGMVLMLLGINNIVYHRDWDENHSTDDLRKEIDEDMNVISESSVFSRFLVSKDKIAADKNRSSDSLRL